jgi:hypothetical protein
MNRRCERPSRHNFNLQLSPDGKSFSDGKVFLTLQE